MSPVHGCPVHVWPVDTSPNDVWLAPPRNLGWVAARFGYR